MSNNKTIKTLLAMLLALSFSLSARAEGGDYLLATATTGGTFYPVGVAIATLTKVKLQPKQNIGMSAINSAGSGENVRLLRLQETQFAMLQGLFGYYAWTGSGPVAAVGKQEHLRSVSMLWQNVEQFIVAADRAGAGDISAVLNLSGSKMAMGLQNSGTIGSNRAILANLGMDMDANFDLLYAGYGPSVDALQNGQVVGISAPAGVPTGVITKLFAAKGDAVRMLSFTPSQARQADGGFGLWTPFNLKAGTYPGQEQDIMTIAQPNFLAVHSSVPEEHVYQITKVMYENLPFLNAIHSATKAMALERAIAGLPAPLHPGALRYYREVGLDIPANLIAR